MQHACMPRPFVPLALCAALGMALLLGGCALPENVSGRASEMASAAVATAAVAADSAAGTVAGSVSGMADSARDVAGSAVTAAGAAASTAADVSSDVACTALASIETNLDGVAIVAPDTAVSDVLEYKRRIDSVIGPIRAASIFFGLDPVTQVVLAYDSLGLLLRTLPPDATVGPAADAVNAALVGVVVGADRAQTALTCPKE